MNELANMLSLIAAANNPPKNYRLAAARDLLQRELVFCKKMLGATEIVFNKLLRYRMIITVVSYVNFPSYCIDIRLKTIKTGPVSNWLTCPSTGFRELWLAISFLGVFSRPLSFSRFSVFLEYGLLAVAATRSTKYRHFFGRSRLERNIEML